MTPRERVYRTIGFEETDIVPYQVGFTYGARQRMAEYLGDGGFEAKLGNHLAVHSHRRKAAWVEFEPGHFRDEWGVEWNRTIDRDIGIIENRLLPEATLAGYEIPDPASAAVLGSYPAFIDANRDRFRIASLGCALFERAWTLRGMDNLLMDMIESPAFVHELFDRITEYDLAQIDLACALDIDAVLFGDDWGSQNGLIMSPRLWREFIGPRIKRMYARVHQHGKPVFIHCCGDARAVLPDLVEAGLNVFNPFQPETMDIFETKQRYHGRLAFYGGISVQHLLPHGTPDQVRTETAHLLRELGRGGGYIASPSHDVPVDVPPENVAAMVEILKGQS